MTRKDYIAFAAAIKFSLPAIKENTGEWLLTWQTVRNVANNLADVLARDNSRFDRDRFLKACGVQS